ncbi:MAG: F0F1 ATP synthase subunit epsilon [Bacteroidales bacterium]|nr:F0F1 ATP synthase subunit epsilon [Bacteroidales bacterium]
MENGVLMLHILSPEKTLFKGKVSQVRLPGTKAPFMVLYNHAPLITSLEAGAVRWSSAEGNGELAVLGGFAEVKDNNVTLCVETL